MGLKAWFVVNPDVVGVPSPKAHVAPVMVAAGSRPVEAVAASSMERVVPFVDGMSQLGWIMWTIVPVDCLMDAGFAWRRVVLKAELSK